MVWVIRRPDCVLTLLCSVLPLPALQPSNLLLNSDCQVKLADFGLARSVSQLNATDGHNPILTDYVATRWCVGTTQPKARELDDQHSTQCQHCYESKLCAKACHMLG